MLRIWRQQEISYNPSDRTYCATDLRHTSSICCQKTCTRVYPRKNSATKSLMFWSCFELTSNHCHIFKSGNFRCHLCQPRHAGILTAVVHVCVEKLNSHKKPKTTYIHCCPCPSPSRFYGVCRNLVGAEYQKGVSGVSRTFSHRKKQ